MSYLKLEHHFRTIANFEEIGAIVNWDQAVNMPEPAGPRRAAAMASLTRLIHDLVADPQLQDWIADAEADSTLDEWQKANLREISRQVIRATALPADLVEATAVACTTSEQAWRRFRSENDFASYAPHLERVVDHQRNCAAALAERLGTSPYDALMDAFEYGVTEEVVVRAFRPLKDFLPGFIDRVIEKQASESIIPLVGPFSVDRQRELALQMMQVAGLDMDRVRIDVSHHPFCAGVRQDVRITNRYREEEFLTGLMGILHEAGHGKYEQNLPERYMDQPVGHALGMAVHESQSLLQEMQVSRGRDFLTYVASKIGGFFPEQARRQPDAFQAENLFRLQTRVRKSLIRVDADEVTYPAHIMLRFDLERELIAGRLEVRDLPEAWNAKMQEYLGLSTAGNDRDGCMQDVHWPSGAFGYFPMYTLGAMVAAQLLHAAQQALGDFSEQLRRGDLTVLNEWLKQNIWSKGRLLEFERLLTAATGEPLNPACFMAHLTSRYEQD